jgi:hypothetical protein
MLLTKFPDQAIYVFFALLTFFACFNVRSYFKDFKYQDGWSSLAGTAFGVLGVVITQPLTRMFLVLIPVIATGLLVYFFNVKVRKARP